MLLCSPRLVVARKLGRHGRDLPISITPGLTVAKDCWPPDLAVTKRGNRRLRAMHTASDRNETRILVVDDHALVRRGLVRLVDAESDLTVCAEAENAEEALEAVEHQRVDLAIVDISLGGTNGLELTEIMKSRYPDILVLVLSVHDGLFYARRALGAGASGYVAKHEASEKIIAAIHQILGGEVYVSCGTMTGAKSDTISGTFDSRNAEKATEIRSCERPKHKDQTRVKP